MYNLNIGYAGTCVTLPVSGCEAAYAAFETACGLPLATVILWDAETGEVLADNTEDDVGIPLPTDADLSEAWWEG